MSSASPSSTTQQQQQQQQRDQESQTDNQTDNQIDDAEQQRPQYDEQIDDVYSSIVAAANPDGEEQEQIIIVNGDNNNNSNTDEDDDPPYVFIDPAAQQSQKIAALLEKEQRALEVAAAAAHEASLAAAEAAAATEAALDAAAQAEWHAELNMAAIAAALPPPSPLMGLYNVDDDEDEDNTVATNQADKASGKLGNEKQLPNIDGNNSSYADKAYNYVLPMLPGACAGFVQAIVGHPFDTIKTKMQAAAFTTQSITAPPNPHASASAVSSVFPTLDEATGGGSSQQQQRGGRRLPRSVLCAQQIYQRDGPMGFYRGVTVPIYMNSIKRSMQYMVWDKLKEMNLNPFVSGSITGAFGTVTFGCPAHVIKVHSQVIGDRNAFAAAKYVFVRKGIKGFYSGLPANITKDIVFAGCYLGLYEKYKHWRPKSSYAEAAGIASVFVWTVFLPIDTVKTAFQSPNRTVALAMLRRQRDMMIASLPFIDKFNIMARMTPARGLPAVLGGTSSSTGSGTGGGGGGGGWYSTAAGGEGGVRSFFIMLRRAYAGLGPAIFRAGPANAASMSAYEWAKDLLKQKKAKRTKQVQQQQQELLQARRQPKAA